MSKKQIQWLYEELPNLIGKGVLSTEAGEKLRQHYGDLETGGSKRWAVVLFGILGGALIAFGIILLLAHNWDEITRPVRAIISFLPLLTAAGLAGYVLWKYPDSTAWKEGVGTFWTISIGATISLVAQTYHIGGDFAAFVLTWSLAALPIVYLLNCSVTAILFWIGATVWAGNVSSGYGTVAWFWPMIGLAAPHLFMASRQNPHQAKVVVLFWILAICGAFGIGFTLERHSGISWIPAFTSYFATLYMAGALWFNEGRNIWQRPLQTIGGLGVITLGIVLSFGDAWDDYQWMEDWNHSPSEWVQAVILAAWPLTALGLWAYAWIRRDPITLIFGSLPIIGIIGSLLGGFHSNLLAMIVMNLYVLGLGVALISLGVRDWRLGIVNLGMLTISVLIITRFFDTELSFLLRGLVFIAVGIGFLTTNMMLIRRKGGAQ